MDVLLPRKTTKGERIIRAAMLQMNNGAGGRLFKCTDIIGAKLTFGVHDPRGVFIVEAETESGRRIFAKLEL